MLLSHYSKSTVSGFRNDLHRSDNEHKPGGLWLSDDGAYGWRQFVIDRLHSGASDWSDGRDLLQYRYDFTINFRESDRVLILKNPVELERFTAQYAEAHLRSCEVDRTAGYGRHIEWRRVKSDYKGILITPFQAELSRRDPDYHWYRFDCASGCVWDISCLTPWQRPSGSSLRQ